MRKRIIIIIIALFFLITPMPRKRNIKNLNIEDANYTFMVTLNTFIMSFRKRESIITKLPSIKDVAEDIKPVLHIKYKNVVSRVKFRVQSARMVVDDARYFYLKNTNTCSIIRTRDYVTLAGLFF